MHDRSPHWRVFEQPLLSIDEARKQAGLDWSVESRPLFYPAPQGDDVGLREMQGTRVLVRTDTHNTVGVVTSEHIPFGNKEALQILDDLADYRDVEIVGAGELLGGSYVWGLCLSPTPDLPVTGNPMKTGFMVVKTYDGKYAHSLYPVLVFPESQSLLKFTDAALSLTKKKNKKIHFLLDPRQASTHLQDFFSDICFVLSAAQKIDLPVDRWARWLKEMLPKVSGLRDTLVSKFEEKPTLLHSLELTAEYLEYSLPSRKRAAESQAESHLYSRWFKTGDRIQAKFLKMFDRWLRSLKS